MLDENDHTVYERRLPNDLAAITPVLHTYQAELARCVVESTYNWYWRVDGLLDEGFAVQLTHLLRLGILPTGYIYKYLAWACYHILKRHEVFDVTRAFG